MDINKQVTFTKAIGILIILLLPSVVIAKSGYIRATGGQDLASVLRKDLGVPTWLVRKKKFIENVQKANPHISNFNKLNGGEILKVDLPAGIRLNPTSKTPLRLVRNKKELENASNARKRPRNHQKYANKWWAKQRSKKRPAPAKEDSKKIVSSKNENKKQGPPGKYDWGISAFYTLSKGTYTEQLKDDGGSATSTQDSPATLGIAAFKKLNDEYSYSGSFYLSMLDAGQFDTGETVTVPPEIGLTSYIGYQRKNWPVEIYTGLDQEMISSYNTDEIPDDEKLSTRSHNLTYLTAGISKFFTFKQRGYLVKASLSNTIMSSQSRPSLNDDSPFTGYKFILYLNTKLNDKWLAHFLYKEHHLSGATELIGNRFGFGVGYKF